MRVLVTGARGFVGQHVTDALVRSGHTPLSVNHTSQDKEPGVDITDEAAVQSIVNELQPDACIHLAGLAFVPLSWREPERVLSVNTMGTVHLLEAFRRHAPEARFLFASSAEVYGRSPSDAVITEDTPLLPDNPYALSKMSADMTTLLYHRRYGMHAMSARPHNHIGPGQSADFVVPSFARQLMAISEGSQEPIMRVGNLESKRYFTDVRDIARAYVLLLEGGSAGQTYNVASTCPVAIETVLDQLCDIVGTRPDRERDESLYRPTDHTAMISTEKIKTHVGWEAELPLRTTLADIVDALRAP